MVEAGRTGLLSVRSNLSDPVLGRFVGVWLRPENSGRPGRERPGCGL